MGLSGEFSITTRVFGVITAASASASSFHAGGVSFTLFTFAPTASAMGP